MGYEKASKKGGGDRVQHSSLTRKSKKTMSIKDGHKCLRIVYTRKKERGKNLAENGRKIKKAS